MAKQPQCDWLIWHRKEVTACLSRARGHVNLLDYGAGRRRARLRDDAKMWQWGNSVTAYCVMSQWFPRLIVVRRKRGEKKNGEQWIQHMMKGSPCWWGICEPLFKDRMAENEKGEKEKWMSAERNIAAIVHLIFYLRGGWGVGGRVRGGGGGDAVCTTSRLL